MGPSVRRSTYFVQCNLSTLPADITDYCVEEARACEWRPVERPRPATINKADFLRQIAAFVQVHEPRFLSLEHNAGPPGFLPDLGGSVAVLGRMMSHLLRNYLICIQWCNP